MMSGDYTSIDNQKVSGSVPAVPDPPSFKFSDSNLQTFPPSGTEGKISGGSRPPRDVDDTFSRPGSVFDESQQSGWFWAFLLSTYKPYFDIDTIEVLERIKDSLYPFNGTFNEKTANNSDLTPRFLGSFLLHLMLSIEVSFVARVSYYLTSKIQLKTNTYGFSIEAASIGTFVTYLSHKLKHQEWNYDINLVTWSVGLFYGYVTIVPLGLYLVLKYFSVPSGLVQLLCLYGYSLFVFIPALCMSVVPWEIFRWLIAGMAGLMSASFVALNLRAHILSAGERWVLIVASIFVLQLALAVALKVYLFKVTV
ncbi:hypothetical protein Fmac_024562 [Flemingia macrophylla]|uniref:Protein YIP n=1 Tax=Flemingia macrophylla TaxID=520843 RepID=A0ABD1LPS5_9FABA